MKHCPIWLQLVFTVGKDGVYLWHIEQVDENVFIDEDDVSVEDTPVLVLLELEDLLVDSSPYLLHDRR